MAIDRTLVERRRDVQCLDERLEVLTSELGISAFAFV